MLLDRPIVFGLRIMLRKYLTTGSLGVEAIYSRRTFVRINCASSYVFIIILPNAYRTIRKFLVYHHLRKARSQHYGPSDTLVRTLVGRTTAAESAHTIDIPLGTSRIILQ
jgi:hypothetical protein